MSFRQNQHPQVRHAMGTCMRYRGQLFCVGQCYVQNGRYGVYTVHVFFKRLISSTGLYNTFDLGNIVVRSPLVQYCRGFLGCFPTFLLYPSLLHPAFFPSPSAPPFPLLPLFFSLYPLLFSQMCCSRMWFLVSLACHALLL